MDDFSSASSINYHKEKLYVTGDDAAAILILNSNYDRLDSIRLFNYIGNRIPKAQKADLEAAVVVEVNQQTELLVFGSGSKKERMQAIRIPIADQILTPQPIQFHSTKEFISRIENNIEEVNLEGATVFQNGLILGNRGNRSNPKNHLIFTSMDFWNRQHQAALSISELTLPVEHAQLLSVSELCYVESLNTLLLTLSSEESDNAYDDGAIGHSYLAWINSFSEKIRSKNIAIDGLTNLSECHPDFRNEKIEGICVESVFENTVILHLASDNDNGSSKFFKARLIINDQTQIR